MTIWQHTSHGICVLHLKHLTFQGHTQQLLVDLHLFQWNNILILKLELLQWKSSMNLWSCVFSIFDKLDTATLYSSYHRNNKPVSMLGSCNRKHKALCNLNRAHQIQLKYMYMQPGTVFKYKQSVSCLKENILLHVQHRPRGG